MHLSNLISISIHTTTTTTTTTINPHTYLTNIYPSKFIPSLATLLLILIFSPLNTKTHGTIVNTAATPPKRLLAPGNPSPSNICRLNNGNTAANIFRQKL